jgi:glutaconate CoA-transferase subunit A
MASLSTAVETLDRDGDSIALEGFSRLNRFAAGHEPLRQGRRELGADPDDPGRPDRSRRRPPARVFLRGQWELTRCTGFEAVQNGWPRPTEIEEHSHVGL